MIAADPPQHIEIEGGIGTETPIKVVAEAMVPVEFVEQLGDEPRRAAEVLDLALPAQVSRILRFRLRASI